jgi:hypothetical protein
MKTSGARTIPHAIPERGLLIMAMFFDPFSEFGSLNGDLCSAPREWAALQN